MHDNSFLKRVGLYKCEYEINERERVVVNVSVCRLIDREEIGGKRDDLNLFIVSSISGHLAWRGQLAISCQQLAKSAPLIGRLICSGPVYSCLVLLGGEKEDMDVGEDTTGGDGSAAKESVELLIVADGELDVTGHNSGLLVVLGGVASELEDLSGEVLKDGGKVDRGAGTNALSVSALLHEASDSSNGELKSSLGCSADGAGSGLALSSSSFSGSGHCVTCLCLF